MSKYESFIVILKPDAIDRGLFGRIITRFEDAGFDIIDMKYGSFGREQWKKHYAEHEEKAHFKYLINHMTDRDVAVFCLGGQYGIFRARKMIGNTNPMNADPGTIRGDFGNKTGIIADNLVHVSDSEISAEREWDIWFQGDKTKIDQE